MPLVLDGTNGVSGVDGTASNPAIEGTDSNTGIFYPAADTVAIGTGGTERVRVSSAGVVGVNTTSPAAIGANYGTIDIRGSSGGGFNLGTTGTLTGQIYGNAGGITYDAQGALTHFWYTNSLERMRLDASGNLLVGTTSGSYAITARRAPAASDNQIMLEAYRTTGANSGVGDYLSTANGLYGHKYIGSNWFGSLIGTTGIVFNTGTLGSETERARIDSSGNFLVGGTSLNESFSGVPTIQGSTNCIFTNKRNTTSSASQFRFYNPNGQVGDISTSGSATTYGTSSDYRLKENVQPMSNALAKVAELKPVTYKWKVDGSDGQGFIAHELQSVCPDAVIGEKDAVQTYTDEDGNEQTRPVYQSIDTSFLVATLTAAIQELNAKVDAQAAEIAALKGNA